jgi:cell division protein FtsA
MPQRNTQDNLVFGLDIGTRNVVGTVGYLEHGHFKVVAMEVREHETRAMLDGQIHDIYKVGETIRIVKTQLEKQLNRQLTEVCIAAAGRVLRTIDVHAEYTFENETRVNQEHIYSLDMIGVEKAHEMINDGSANIKFYCVGNTPVRYYLNGYVIHNLDGHKANTIGVDLIATFLPEEVVDGLYEAVGYADLQVASLTLEPIAAINVAIPEQFRLLNIALIDVGAGTSDISITRDGSVMAYGMIPYAGDEITEQIAKTYLVDFNTAEKIKHGASKKKQAITYKDIMGISQKVTSEDVCAAVEKTVSEMASLAAKKICELNGGQATSAVFVVGGGGKIPGYTEKLAQYLKLAKERVALRGEEVLTSVDFMVDNYKKDSLYVTPVGICMNYYNQKNNFVFVQVNGQRIKLYDNNKLTVVDAVMQSNFPNDLLFPRRGRELNFTVNGKSRMVRGEIGEAARIQINGHDTSMNAHIEKNDKIEIIESTVGEPAHCTIGQLEEFKSTLTFCVDGKTIVCPKFAYVNGRLESEYYEIQENDEINMENYYTVAQIFEFLDIDISDKIIRVNNVTADVNDKVYENFDVSMETLKVAERFDELQETDAEELEQVKEKSQEYAKKQMELREQKLAEAAQTEGVSEEGVEEQPAAPNRDLAVLVNHTPVALSGKPEYSVVDIFLVYEFDLNASKGRELVIKINGVESSYTTTLHDGDHVEVYWKE